MFAIERGVAIPPKVPKHRRLGSKFPIAEMRVGDSFFAPGYVIGGTEKPPHFKFLVAKNFSRQIPNSQWTSRTVTEAGVRGVRVWRVK